MAGFVAAFNSIVKKRCDGQIKPEIEDQAVKLVNEIPGIMAKFSGLVAPLQQSLASIVLHDALFFDLDFEMSGMMARMAITLYENFLKSRTDEELRMSVVAQRFLDTSELRIGVLAGEMTSVHPLVDVAWKTMEKLASSNQVAFFDIGKSKVSCEDRRIWDMVRASGVHYVDLRHLQTSVNHKSSSLDHMLRSVKKIAEVIARFNLHILMDMTGLHTGRGGALLIELFGKQISEVIVVHGNSFAASTGSKIVDFYMTDRFVTPPTQVQHWTEPIAYVPGSYFSVNHADFYPHLDNRLFGRTKSGKSYVLNARHPIPACSTEDVETCLGDLLKKGEAPLLRLAANGSEVEEEILYIHGLKVADLYGDNYLLRFLGMNRKVVIVTFKSDFGIPEDKKLLFNMNSVKKWTYSIFQVAMKVLQEVPESVLVCRHEHLTVGQAKSRFKAASQGQLQRIVFVDEVPKEAHLRRYQFADACIDTYPCNGHTTTVDALYAGAPVVTLRDGKCMASRVSESALVNGLKLDCLVAVDEKELKEKLVCLLTNTNLAKLIKMEIKRRVRRSVTFNTDYTAGIWEHLFRQMIQIKREGLAEQVRVIEASAYLINLARDLEGFNHLTNDDVKTIRMSQYAGVFGDAGQVEMFGNCLHGRHPVQGRTSGSCANPGELFAEPAAIGGNDEWDKGQVSSSSSDDDDDDANDDDGVKDGSVDKLRDQGTDGTMIKVGSLLADSPESVRSKYLVDILRIRQLEFDSEAPLAQYLRLHSTNSPDKLDFDAVMKKKVEFQKELLRLEDQEKLFPNFNGFVLHCESTHPGTYHMNYCALCRKNATFSSNMGLQNHYNSHHSFTNTETDNDNWSPPIRFAANLWSLKGSLNVFPSGYITTRQGALQVPCPKKPGSSTKNYKKTASTKDVPMDPITCSPVAGHSNFVAWRPLLTQKLPQSMAGILEDWNELELREVVEMPSASASESDVSLPSHESPRVVGQRRPRSSPPEPLRRNNRQHSRH